MNHYSDVAARLVYDRQQALVRAADRHRLAAGPAEPRRRWVVASPLEWWIRRTTAQPAIAGAR